MLTIHDVMARLNVSKSTAYKLVESGALRHVWVRGTLRVPVEVMEAFIAGGGTPPRRRRRRRRHRASHAA